jgi:hypothetical protein
MGTQLHRVRLSHQPDRWVVVDHSEYVDAVRSGRVAEEAHLNGSPQSSPAKDTTKPSKEG